MRTRIAIGLAVMLGILPAAGRADEMPGHGTSIPDLDQLVATARQMSPALAVSALESDAAAAKAIGADSLPDPKFQWQAMDIPATVSNSLPSQLPRTDKFFLQQEFPLWGKRDLKREIAAANAQKAAALRIAAENELVARIKAVYAEYHQIHQTIDLDRELAARMGAIAKLATLRYAQGRGSQQEATSAEIERTQLNAELLALENQRRIVAARLNTLVGRDPRAPLVETPHLRPIPADLELGDLTERARLGNPDLRVEDSAINSAEKSVSLAEKGLYPDIAVSFGGVKSYGRFSGYEGMLEVTLPIRGDLHDAEIGEAKAMAGSARSKKDALALSVENELNDAYWSLRSASGVEKLIVESSLPQARLGFESAAHAYEVGKGEFIMVLTAEQQWRKTHLEHLKVQMEQQVRLAQIEKLIGGRL